MVSIDQRPIDGIVAVGTHGSGAFYSKQFFPLSISPTTTAKNKFDLQIFPNPTTDNCALQFNLQSSKTIHLYIVDIFGRRCLTIGGNALLKEGQHTFHVNTSGLKSGQYIVVAEDELGQKSSNKLIVQ